MIKVTPLKVCNNMDYADISLGVREPVNYNNKSGLFINFFAPQVSLGETYLKWPKTKMKTFQQ